MSPSLLEKNLATYCISNVTEKRESMSFDSVYNMMEQFNKPFITHQGRTELLKVKHFILILLSQFLSQNDRLLPHLLGT